MGDGMIEIWGKEIPGFLPELGQNVPVLDPYLVDSDSPTAAVVVCPGGAYMGKAPHEGKDIAKWLNTIGISAFVLDYRVRPYRHPVPISDARRAVQFVRANAERFNVDSSKIGIIGFSAGGHLAASTAVYPLEGNPAAEDPVERVSSRPDCLILGYPVISMERYHHQGSRNNLLGPDPQPELVDALSLEKHVHGNLPPVFIWHTADDEVVSVMNSLMFAEGLAGEQIDFALHIFPNGRHGLGLAEEQPDVAAWTDLLAAWLVQIGFRRGE